MRCPPALALPLLWGGCGFTVDGAGKVDAPPIDMPPPQFQASCKALHAAQPSLASGEQMIDPDGTGPDAALLVYCDMTTSGGGWTVVFNAASSNLTSANNPYTSATPRLLTDATDALLAYRDSARVALTNSATFAMPSEWRTKAPFEFTNVDKQVSVSVNGQTPTTAQLRFGNASFSSDCDDPWDLTGNAFGRLCIVGTAAPFFSGFAASTLDACTDSTAVWNAANCSASVRLSIAVR